MRQVLPPYQSPSGTTCSAYLFVITKPAGFSVSFGPHLSMLSTRRDNKPTHTRTHADLCVCVWKAASRFYLNFVSCRNLICTTFVSFQLQVRQFGQKLALKKLKARAAATLSTFLAFFSNNNSFQTEFSLHFLFFFSIKAFKVPETLSD